jgi:hypothetical protein
MIISKSEDCSDCKCRNETHITKITFISCQKLLSAYYTSATSDKVNTCMKQQRDKKPEMQIYEIKQLNIGPQLYLNKMVGWL